MATKKYRETHQAVITKYSQSHKAIIKSYNQSYYQANKDKMEEQQLQLKTDVLTHYGNGKLSCVLCGYNKDIRALSLDHINGHGSNHRKTTNIRTGNYLYYSLKKTNYPKGYQTLCMNCQFIKAAENKENNKWKTKQKLVERQQAPLLFQLEDNNNDRQT